MPETRTPPSPALPTLQSYFAPVVDFTSPRFELFAFFRQILKLTTFLTHLIRCSVQDLYLNKVVLPWSDYIVVFNEMGKEKPQIRKFRNTLCK